LKGDCDREPRDKRVFSLRKDHYNGINYAFLLNVRATLNTADSERAGADVAEARRAYQEVVQICEDWLAGNQPERGERKYWVLATLAEAHYGLGEDDVAEARLNEAYAAAPEEWMKQATEEQLSPGCSRIRQSAATDQNTHRGRNLNSTQRSIRSAPNRSRRGN
jgi:hypothetical protein